MEYALELWGCNSCGKYPIYVIRPQNEEVKEPTCSCGSTTHFEKVYKCNKEGHVLE